MHKPKQRKKKEKEKVYCKLERAVNLSGQSMHIVEKTASLQIIGFKESICIQQATSTASLSVHLPCNYLRGIW